MQPVREGESSKEAKKRFKRQQEAAIATSLQQGSAGIRILSDNSTFVPHVSPNRGADEAPQVQRKKTRGSSRLRTDPKGSTRQIQIDWNGLDQPVGHLSSKFSTQLEIIAHGLVPMTLINWSHLYPQLKNDLWTCVQDIREK